jgi:hypothetical protein
LEEAVGVETEGVDLSEYEVITLEDAVMPEDNVDF